MATVRRNAANAGVCCRVHPHHPSIGLRPLTSFRSVRWSSSSPMTSKAWPWRSSPEYQTIVVNLLQQAVRFGDGGRGFQWYRCCGHLGFRSHPRRPLQRLLCDGQQAGQLHRPTAPRAQKATGLHTVVMIKETLPAAAAVGGPQPYSQWLLTRRCMGLGSFVHCRPTLDDHLQ